MKKSYTGQPGGFVARLASFAGEKSTINYTYPQLHLVSLPTFTKHQIFITAAVSMGPAEREDARKQEDPYSVSQTVGYGSSKQ